jgi:hypothetical protein
MLLKLINAWQDEKKRKPESLLSTGIFGYSAEPIVF